MPPPPDALAQVTDNPDYRVVSADPYSAEVFITPADGSTAGYQFGYQRVVRDSADPNTLWTLTGGGNSGSLVVPHPSNDDSAFTATFTEASTIPIFVPGGLYEVSVRAEGSGQSITPTLITVGRGTPDVAIDGEVFFYDPSDECGNDFDSDADRVPDRVEAQLGLDCDDGDSNLIGASSPVRVFDFNARPEYMGGIGVPVSINQFCINNNCRGNELTFFTGGNECFAIPISNPEECSGTVSDSDYVYLESSVRVRVIERDAQGNWFEEHVSYTASDTGSNFYLSADAITVFPGANAEVVAFLIAGGADANAVSGSVTVETDSPNYRFAFNSANANATVMSAVVAATTPVVIYISEAQGGISLSDRQPVVATVTWTGSGGSPSPQTFTIMPAMPGDAVLGSSDTRPYRPVQTASRNYSVIYTIRVAQPPSGDEVAVETMVNRKTLTLVAGAPSVGLVPMDEGTSTSIMNAVSFSAGTQLAVVETEVTVTYWVGGAERSLFSVRIAAGSQTWEDLWFSSHTINASNLNSPGLRVNGGEVMPGVFGAIVAPRRINADTSIRHDQVGSGGTPTNPLFASTLTDIVDDVVAVYDYRVLITGGQRTVNVVATLANALDGDRQYSVLKYRGTPGGEGFWMPFRGGDAGNVYWAHASSTRACPDGRADTDAAGSPWYTPYRGGEECVMFRIVDGGPNDDDETVNGIIIDPVAIVADSAVRGGAGTTGRGTGGGSGSGSSGSSGGGGGGGSSSLLMLFALFALLALRLLSPTRAP